MGRIFRSFLVFVAVSLAAGTIVHAGVPSAITVQGKLMDAGGTPLPAGAKTFTFRIFDAGTGGTQVWPLAGGEVQSITSATDGLWVALLGTVSPLNDAVFSDSVRWLEIDVDGTTLPRVKLVTGPYAYRVATVDGASGGTITSKVSIGSGHANTGADAFVTGVDNSVTGNFSAVGGGTLNNASGESSVISGGQQNTASGFASSVGGGASNSAANTYARVSGGLYNSSSGSWSVIDGGILNTAAADGATVGGGGYNNARGLFSTIAGGGSTLQTDSNSAQGDYSQIGGGVSNAASGYGSGIDGGRFNRASGSLSTVGGGQFNFARGAYSTIAGGGGPSIFNDSNSTSGVGNVIGGGAANLTRENFSTISGGYANRAFGYLSAVSGGYLNSAFSQGTHIGGGERNEADGNHSTVGGGTFNYASGEGATVAGGDTNTANADFAYVSGGRTNSATEQYASIAGGGYNVSANTASAVGGGFYNRARGQYSVVAGGGGPTPADSNLALGMLSTVSGGDRNVASGIASVIGGGDSNKSRATCAAVGGGSFNDASGQNSTVPGGNGNTAAGNFSLAAGFRAHANHDGSFVWADHSFLAPYPDSMYSSGPNQFIIRATGGVGIGTSAPQQALSVATGMNIDQSNANDGTTVNSLGFGSGTGEAVASKRTPGGNQYGLDFYCNFTNRMSLTNGGNVGIGTTAPTTATGGKVLHIHNPAGASVVRLGDGATNGIQWEVQSTVFNGTGALNLSNISAFTNPFQFYGNGDFSATGNVCAANVLCPSDERLKEDIHTVPNALDRLDGLRGVEYHWTSDAQKERSLPAGEQIGLIAQEVRKIVPQAVAEQPDGYLAVDYSRLVPLLIEGMKEQQKQIQELRAIIRSMAQ